MLRGLEGQTWSVHRLIVMNTGEENWKEAYEKTTIPMEVHHLTREEFDHGKTRDQAARMSQADYLLFMTQDALPEDRHLIEKLVEAIEQEEKIGAAYARQLPREDCRLMEQYTRQFNYPEKSRVKWLADLPELGIKTYFVPMCAQCIEELYLQLGGLYRKQFNEDMIFAGGLIQRDMEWLMRQRQRWYIPTIIRQSSSFTGTLIWRFHRRITQVFDGIDRKGRGDPSGEKDGGLALPPGKTVAGDPAGMAKRLEVSGLSGENVESFTLGDRSSHDESEILGISGKVHNNTIFGYDKQIHKTRKRIEIQIKDREKNDE